MKSIMDSTGVISWIEEQMRIGNSTPWQKQLHSFTESICHLTWQMQLQQPPMSFDTPDLGQPIDIENQKIIPKNVDFSNLDNTLAFYYLEPNLMHGPSLLEKGRIMPCTRDEMHRLGCKDKKCKKCKPKAKKKEST